MKNKSLSGAINVLNTLKSIEDYKSASTAPDENTLINIHPAEIKNWQYYDRPDDELGDIENLSIALKTEGQQQPCIVRPCKDHSKFKYELIIGQRRWVAATRANLHLLCLVKNISDKEAAIAQSAENNNRKDLSEYAKSMNYSMLINQGIIKPKELMAKLNINKMQFSRLMSFKKIPTHIQSSMGNMSNVSARTASQIVQLSLKGKIYEDAIIQIANKIASGAIGHSTLAKMVGKIIAQKKNNNSDLENKISDQINSITLIKLDGSFENNIAIYLPNEISSLISSDKNTSETIVSAVKKALQKILIDCNPRVTKK